MGKKKKKDDTEINLDSFLDIMTCLVGVLVLIIILTGIDAAQIKVLINTPMEYDSDKRPIFIECRNNQLYRIDLDELNRAADEELKKIAGVEHTSTKDIYRKAGISKDAKNEFYWVDLTFHLVGQTVLNPIRDMEGYPLADNYANRNEETSEKWYGQILTSLNKEDQMLAFIVRDDSFRAFKLARALAWMERIDVSYELMPQNEQIRFGIFGERPTPQ